MSSSGFFRCEYAETNSVVLEVDQPDFEVVSTFHPPISIHLVLILSPKM